MRVLSIATGAMLPAARVMARGVRQFNPDWPVTVIRVGAAVPGPPDKAPEDPEAGPEWPEEPGESPEQRGAPGDPFTLVELPDAMRAQLPDLLVHLDPLTLIELLTPGLLLEHARESGEPTLLLAPTTRVFDDLAPVAAGLDGAGVVLMARLDAELPHDGLSPTALDLRWAGRITPSCMAHDGSPRALEFLGWWASRLNETLRDGPPARKGLVNERDREWASRYLELAPSLFSTTVLADRGANVSYWNLFERPLEGGADGISVAGAGPLRFMDLTGFAPDRPHRLSREATRVGVSEAPVLRELAQVYASELSAAGWRDFERRADVGRPLPNGITFDERLRALYAVALILGEGPRDIFTAAGADEFTRWLRAPAPEGARHGITRYAYRVYLEWCELPEAYPDLDQDPVGFAGWCWVYGPPTMGVATELCPPPPPTVELAELDAARLAVRVCGYFGHTLGLGAAARSYVGAFEAAGVPVSTLSVGLTHIDRSRAGQGGYGEESFTERAPDFEPAFDVICVNPDELPAFAEEVGETVFSDRPRIGIWGWETNRIPGRWAEAFELVDEIWVYSRFMAENVGRVAPVPVICLPPPVIASAGDAPPLRLGVPDGFLFLFVFDYLSTIERKNPVGLIEAFRAAFEPGEGPQLLIKTLNAPLRPQAVQELLWARADRQDIHLVDRSLTASERDGLMAACDCYVSLHRAEGFGLTMAECMAAGKPVIATAYSGNTDFMTPANSYPVDFTMTHVGPDCEIYPADGEWAAPSVEHAAEQLRRVWSDPARAARVGARARRDIDASLSPAATGRQLRARLERLVRRGPARLRTGAAAGS